MVDFFDLTICSIFPIISSYTFTALLSATVFSILCRLFSDSVINTVSSAYLSLLIFGPPTFVPSISLKLLNISSQYGKNKSEERIHPCLTSFLINLLLLSIFNNPLGLVLFAPNIGFSRDESFTTYVQLVLYLEELIKCLRIVNETDVKIFLNYCVTSF